MGSSAFNAPRTAPRSRFNQERKRTLLFRDHRHPPSIFLERLRHLPSAGKKMIKKIDPKRARLSPERAR